VLVSCFNWISIISVFKLADCQGQTDKIIQFRVFVSMPDLFLYVS